MGYSWILTIRTAVFCPSVPGHQSPPKVQHVGLRSVESGANCEASKSCRDSVASVDAWNFTFFFGEFWKELVRAGHHFFSGSWDRPFMLILSDLTSRGIANSNGSFIHKIGQTWNRLAVYPLRDIGRKSFCKFHPMSIPSFVISLHYLSFYCFLHPKIVAFCNPPK